MQLYNAHRYSGQVLAAALEPLMKTLLYKTNQQPRVSHAQQLCAFQHQLLDQFNVFPLWLRKSLEPAGCGMASSTRSPQRVARIYQLLRKLIQFRGVLGSPS